MITGSINKSSDNSFLLFCNYASRRNLCWNIFCTTCGSHEFRSGIYALMKANHFTDDDHWLTLCKTYKGPWFEWPVSEIEYEKFSKVVQNCKLTDVAESCKFPDWLGYLGICLSWLEKWEQEEKHLTQIWGSQLIELCQQKDSFPEDLLSKIENQTGYLHYSDLGYFESEISQTRF
jgi:hypothetical protein